MNYLALRERPAQFLALTSLLPAEFDELLTDFAPRWERHHRFHTLDGGRRRLPAHRERANATLSGTDTKLFFLLVYLKTNALQQHQAASFGVSQTRVSRLAGPLLDVLNQTLAARHLLPVRDGAQLAQRLVAHPDKVFTCDGVERGIPRNADRAGQEEEYSAKKKVHALKNITLSDDTQYLHYLSPTESGRMHDKKVVDEYPLCLPAGSVLRQDLGFLGHCPPGVLVEMPHKRLPKGELTFSQLLYNQLLSALRVVIEHVHSGIKRLRMVRDRLRLRGDWFRDTVMVVACGLHNLRVRSPHRAYIARGAHES